MIYCIISLKLTIKNKFRGFQFIFDNYMRESLWVFLSISYIEKKHFFEVLTRLYSIFLKIITFISL